MLGQVPTTPATRRPGPLAAAALWLHRSQALVPLAASWRGGGYGFRWVLANCMFPALSARPGQACKDGGRGPGWACQAAPFWLPARAFDYPRCVKERSRGGPGAGRREGRHALWGGRARGVYMRRERSATTIRCLQVYQDHKWTPGGAAERARAKRPHLSCSPQRHRSHRRS